MLVIVQQFNTLNGAVGTKFLLIWVLSKILLDRGHEKPKSI